GSGSGDEQQDGRYEPRVVQPEERVADAGGPEHQRGVETSRRDARRPVAGLRVAIDERSGGGCGAVAVRLVIKELAGDQNDLRQPRQTVTERRVVPRRGEVRLDRAE